jgi:DNA-binding NarL/FixJ family response regulator
VPDIIAAMHGSDLRDLPAESPAERSGLSRARVLVADDHQAMLESLVSVLTREHDVIAAVPDARSLIAAAKDLDPDVLVVDVQMPGLCGIAAAHCLKGGGCRAKLVFVTMHPEREYVQDSLALGPVGFVAKQRLALDLLPAVRSVLQGQPFVSPSISR